MPSKSQARRAAKKAAAGQRQLPRATTSAARRAATKYEVRVRPHQSELSQVPPDDRDWIVRIMLQGWWDNDESLTDMRRHGSAQSVYNKSVKYSAEGAPSNRINITFSDTPGLYLMYLDRDSG